MTQQIINVGAAPNDGTGDPLQTALTKSNANFTELYARGSAPQGRLTLQTATPVMATTQSAKTTIYYTPYVGNQVPIYNGASMLMTTFTELSVAITDTTKSPAAIGASKVNDWFVWSDAGTLRLGHGPDWTNDTTRSAGTALVMVNGILLNNASITNGPAASRGTYIGTTYSGGDSLLYWKLGAIAAGGDASLLGIWNCYNRVRVATFVGDIATTWTLSNAGPRTSNNSGAMRISAVFGLQADVIRVEFTCPVNTPAGVNGVIGVGIDSITTFNGSYCAQQPNVWTTGSARSVSTQIGFHYWQALEYAAGSGIQFGGQNGSIWQNLLTLEANM